MRVRLLNQPFADSDDLLQVLREWLSDDGITEIDVAVAWVKRSGFRLIIEDLASFRRRGGIFRLILGISAGGATKQGLELALANSDECSVLFVSPSRTFHPKFYVAYGPTIGRAVIGSQNLTGGGLVGNFEVGVELTYDLTRQLDLEAFEAVRNIFSGYQRIGPALIRLNEDVLLDLIGNPRFRIGDEDQPAYAWGENVPVERVGEAEVPIYGPFGQCGVDLRSIPRSLRIPSSSNAGGRRGNRDESREPLTDTHEVFLRWYKKLSAADAQHPLGQNTNPTGHLTLVKAGHDIQHATWFRQHLFANALWSEGAPQYATINFVVEVGGESLGTLPLRVQYRPAFGAGQGNRTSMLHWGPRVGELLKSRDFTGWFVSIELVGRNEYILKIAPEPSGPPKTT